MTDASPVLARVLADQPEYGAWMPAAVCIYRFGRADIAGRELVAPAGRSEMIGTVAYGARVAAASRPTACPCSMVFTNDKRAAKVTDSTAVPFRQVKATFGKAAHGDDERHVIAIREDDADLGRARRRRLRGAQPAPSNRSGWSRGPRDKPVLAAVEPDRLIQPVDGRGAGQCRGRTSSPRSCGTRRSGTWARSTRVGQAELTPDSGLAWAGLWGIRGAWDSTVALPVLALWNLFAIWKVLANSLGNDSVIMRYPA